MRSEKRLSMTLWAVIISTSKNRIVAWKLVHYHFINNYFTFYEVPIEAHKWNYLRPRMKLTRFAVLRSSTPFVQDINFFQKFSPVLSWCLCLRWGNRILSGNYNCFHTVCFWEASAFISNEALSPLDWNLCLRTWKQNF